VAAVEEVRAGTLSQEEFTRSESSMIRSRGHCNTMGTASTMAWWPRRSACRCRVAGTPAPDSRLLEAAHGTGRLAVDMVAADRRPSSQVLTAASFHNAIVALAAIGGSTNAVVHLLAIAGRLGVDLSLDDFDRIGSGVPLLVDLQPAGRFLMEDFHRAGGLPPCCARCATCSTRTRSRSPAAARRPSRRRADLGRRGHPHPRRSRCRRGRHRRAARQPRPGRRVIKPAAASPHLLQHRGRAVVFDSIEDFHARIDDPDLDVDADSVLVLRGCGPKGYPGMPEVATCRCRRSCCEQGVRDMVRVCDGRMSGTAYGTVVLHVAPEAAAGGPLALVRTGDVITLDVPARRLDLDVPADELAAQRSPPPKATASAAPSPSPRAAGRSSTSTTSCRPTPAPTWTSSSAPAARR
jgi:dihydroxyacid dehydratase/phosphogluconate dehydratase